MCGWGNIEEKGQKKRRRRGVFRLRTVALDPNFFFYFFVHPLEGGGGARSIVDRGQKTSQRDDGSFETGVGSVHPSRLVLLTACKVSNSRGMD